jgi:hypothetical protein
MKQLLMAANITALLVGASPVLFAGEYNISEHNGSRISWFFTGSHVIARYETPRRGMKEVGVHPDTILFEGQEFGGEEEGRKLVGKAYTFRRGCPRQHIKLVEAGKVIGSL